MTSETRKHANGKDYTFTNVGTTDQPVIQIRDESGAHLGDFDLVWEGDKWGSYPSDPTKASNFASSVAASYAGGYPRPDLKKP